MKQLAVDLVILNERASSYVQDLQIALETLVRASQSRPQAGVEEPPGRVFVLRADLMSAETRALLASVARVVLVATAWAPVRSARSRRRSRKAAVRTSREAALSPARSRRLPPPAPELEFFNGLGGFAADGREYVTILGPGQWTPAPWINVVANPGFGFQVATEGGGYTWSVNSRENQLTPWSNDPVTDRPGEAFYLRDDDTGELWSPTALPIRDEAATYVARHGRGYSRFEHAAHGIAPICCSSCRSHDPIKISRLTLRNTSDRTRRLSVTAYVEWVLGPSRAAVGAVRDDRDRCRDRRDVRPQRWNSAFGSRVAFADLSGRQTDWTGDRREFIGRNGTLARPAALAGAAPLSKTLGAGLDPCGALRTAVELPPRGSVEVVFFLGRGRRARTRRGALIAHYRAADLDAVLSRGRCGTGTTCSAPCR